MSKELIVKSKFTLSDEFSGKFGKMMDFAQKKFDKSQSAVSRMNDFISNNQEGIKKVAKTTAIAGGIIFGSLGYAASQAVEFEKAMAGVAKYANVDLGSAEFSKLGDEAKTLSVDLGISSQEVADLMQNLAGGGVAIEDLSTVTKLAGQMAVAFDISGDAAGEAFIKTKNALNLTIDETQQVMDSINQLGNAYAANSDQILDFMALGGAGVANSLKAGGDAVAAFGSRLISMGETSSTAATIMQAFTRAVSKDKELSKVFDAAGGGADGMFAVIDKGSKLSGEAQKKFFSKFGNYGLAIQNLSSNTGALRESMDLATDATGRAGSVQQEFENASNTSAAKLAKLKITLENIVVTIGDALLPVINDFAAFIGPIIKNVSDWMKENKSLVKGLVIASAVIGGVLLAISAVSTAMLVYNKIFTAGASVMKVFNLIVSMNPFGLLLIAVVAVIAAIGLAISKFDSFGSVLLVLMGPIGMLINGFMLLKYYWDSIVDAFKSDGILAGIKRIGVFLLDMVLYPVQQLLNLLSKIPGMGKLAGGARDMVNEMRSNMGAVDIGGELSSTTTNVVKTPPVSVNDINNKSEVLLKIDNGAGIKTQDITNGSFTFNTMPAVGSTLK